MNGNRSVSARHVGDRVPGTSVINARYIGDRVPGTRIPLLRLECAHSTGDSVTRARGAGRFDPVVISGMGAESLDTYPENHLGTRGTTAIGRLCDLSEAQSIGAMLHYAIVPVGAVRIGSDPANDCRVVGCDTTDLSRFGALAASFVSSYRRLGRRGARGNLTRFETISRQWQLHCGQWPVCNLFGFRAPEP